MKLYFGGGEIPTHRKFLVNSGIADVQLSFMGLRRRVKFAQPWLIAQKFPSWSNILLDSGAYTVNRGVESGDYADAELAEIATTYEKFVSYNAGRVDAITEFDALAMGLDWIQGRRDDYYDDFGDKFLPVWHAEFGVDELERMAARYKRIALLQTALGDRDLIPMLNMFAERRGTLIHGIAMTKPEIMREVRFDSVASTSWLSPAQYGDTQVWTGHELKRYPRKYKEQSRKRHRTLFTVNGFDAEKIAADDRIEVARLTVWSWNCLMEDINSHRKPKGTDETTHEDVSEPAGQPEERKRILLPGVSLFTPADEDHELVRVGGQSLRMCNTCFLRDRGCPGFKADATCLYELPIEVKTREQLKAVEDGLIAMQTQRVMFMRMVEDLEGGFPDPNLSSEIDRLTRMIKAQREGTADRFSLSISQTNRPGELGALSRIFGEKVAEAQAVEAPNVVDDMIRQSEMGKIYEAEIIDG